MHTRCPACQAIFRIQPEDLAVASGRVRCGECGEVFDARASLQRELPLEQPQSIADLQAGLDLQPPVEGDHDSGPAQGLTRGPTQGPTQGPATGRRAYGTTMPGMLISEIEGEEPAEPVVHRSGWHWLAWSGVNLCLVVLLAAQLLFVQREAFAQDPTLRPVLTEMCDLVGCTLPSRRAVDRIELTRRHVYSHPNVDDALLIDITMVNEARFAQPYPVLTVTLGDRRGEPVVRRSLQPREYEPRLGRDARMAPGSPVNVVLEVRDPGAEARTFDLDFH